MTELHKVRTTIQPDVELEVDDAELRDLKNQGLLLEPRRANKSASSDKE